MGTRLSLATSEQPWARALLDDVLAIAGRIVARATSEPVDRAVVVSSLLHTSALDLAAMVRHDGMPESAPTRRA